MCHREKDELEGSYKMTEESMVCGMSVFEKKVLKRFRIAVGVYSTGSL